MIQEPFSLKDKTIIVTGASSGIGRAIAVACSQQGGKVIIIGRNKDKLNQTNDLLIGDGHSILVVDLTQEESVVSIVNDLPSVDGVVHCAGIGQKVFCRDVTKNDFSSVINSNLFAPVILQKYLMEAKKIVDAMYKG